VTGWFGLVVTALATSTKALYKLRQVLSVLGESTIPIFIHTTQAHSLAIPPWVGTMSTGDVFGRRWGRNGEFCELVGFVNSTASILA